MSNLSSKPIFVGDLTCYKEENIKKSIQRIKEKLRMGCCMTPTGFDIMDQELGDNFK